MNDWDIVDTVEESTDADKEKISLPPLGVMLFSRTCNSDLHKKAQVLKDINLKIEAGTFVGIVGQVEAVKAH